MSQLWIVKGERSLLLTHTAATVNASLCTPTKSRLRFLNSRG